LCRENRATKETKISLENKNALIYGAGGAIGGAVVRTFANVASGTFPSYITPHPWQLSVKESQCSD
jgi:hypothetical protein